MLSASRATKKVFEDFSKKNLKDEKNGSLGNIYKNSLARGEGILYKIICVRSPSPGTKQMKDGVHLLP